MRRACFIALAILGAAPAAVAVEYAQVKPERSAITFVSRQMGVPVDGGFGRFSAQVAFDPARADKARAQIEIDLASVDAGSVEANEELKGKHWFNVKETPKASFASTAVRALGGDRYELAGKLTIRGRTRDVTAPFSFRSEGGGGVFDGSFVLKRLDYGIGGGLWSDVGTVADEVQVRFRIVAVPAGK